MDIDTLGLAVYGFLFILLCWIIKKTVDMILEMTTDIAARYEQLERDMKGQKEDLLKLKSQMIALEYYKQKPHKEPRHARNDIKYENEIENDFSNT